MTRYEALKALVQKWRNMGIPNDECEYWQFKGYLDCADELEAALALPEDSNTVDEKTLVDAARYNWLRNGGWEVMYDNKYWTKENRFDGAIDAGMLDVALQASQARSKNGY